MYVILYIKIQYKMSWKHRYNTKQIKKEASLLYSLHHGIVC